MSRRPGRWKTRLRGLPAKVRRFRAALGLARPDDAWALARLTPAEWGVYRSLDAHEREHALRVARRLSAEHPQAGAELLAAALLHDCGKRTGPFRPVERVLVGLLPPPLAARLPWEAAHLRANHPQLGAKLLRAAGARPRVAALVAASHAPGSDPEARLLAAYDDLE